MSCCKRFVSLLLVMAFLCGFLLTSTVPAASAASQDYTYFVLRHGKAVVLTGYTGTETELILPSEIDGKPVLSVSGFQTDNAAEIQKVVVPDSVRIIGPDSFSQFTALTELVLPDGLFAICEGSFDGCTALRNLQLPIGLHVMLHSFRECPELRFKAYPMTYDRLTNARPNVEAALSDRMDILPYPYTTGDLNADNQINTTDARLLLQAAVGKLSLSEEAAAVSDVNGDSKVDTTDARLVLQYAVGKTDGIAAEILPDIPLVDPDSPDVTVVQTSTPFDETGRPQPIEQPVSSPKAFLQTLVSISSAPCNLMDSMFTWAQYHVTIETPFTTIRVLIFSRAGQCHVEILYGGQCFSYAGGAELLSYLV